MVQTENGMSIRLKAERSAMPVMMPGSAMGRMTRSEIVSRPKNFVRDTAAAISVPMTMEISVATLATFTDRISASQTSGRFHAAANHFSVRPGGGKT